MKMALEQTQQSSPHQSPLNSVSAITDIGSPSSHKMVAVQEEAVGELTQIAHEGSELNGPRGTSIVAGAWPPVAPRQWPPEPFGDWAGNKYNK